MFAHPKNKPSNRQRLDEEALLAKLLTRAVAEAQRTGITVDAETADDLRAELRSAMHHGPLSERDLRAIVKAHSQPRSQSHAAMRGGAFPHAAPNERSADQAPLQQQNHQHQQQPPPQPQLPRMAPTPSPLPTELLLNTTKRQRQLLADQKWIEQANDDRTAAAIGRRRDAQERADQHRRQKEALDSQLAEHKRESDAAAAAKRRAQDNMTEAIRQSREEAMREKREAFEKAQREKAFRERQAHEAEAAREQQRIDDHNDQVRHMILVQQEVQRQRDAEAANKAHKREEWQHTMRENDERLREKAERKEAEREEGRRFQREYAENMDRQDRERAEARARKEARAAKFQAMANVVAEKHMKKVQNLDAKIQAEYDEQLQRSLEDERQRRQRAKQRIQETHNVLERQQAEKKEEERREREEARRTAEAMAAQAQEAARQEAARKQAARQEAARMREFLTTQLQLQHFRETRPLETSIARPESRATTMFSPSRYSPSPKPQLSEH